MIINLSDLSILKNRVRVFYPNRAAFWAAVHMFHEVHENMRLLA